MEPNPNPFNDNNPLERIDKGLQACTSFEELYEKLRALEMIPGMLKSYSSTEIIKVVERVRHHHRTIEFVTRTYGLREVVLKLLETDKVYRKYKKG